MLELLDFCFKSNYSYFFLFIIFLFMCTLCIPLETWSMWQKSYLKCRILIEKRRVGVTVSVCASMCAHWELTILIHSCTYKYIHRLHVVLKVFFVVLWMHLFSIFLHFFLFDSLLLVIFKENFQNWFWMCENMHTHILK